ncbi:MAG: IS21 family transposase [Deltaproteobacteria bacterium]|nr:IS21 family transposase [Deltaproteobacteria bacterium]
MIDKAAVFEIIRLKHLGWSDRKIARHLCIDRSSVKKYAKNPDCTFKVPPRRASKLEPYVEQVQQWLDQDPEVAATVVLQHLSQRGFDGKITIVRDLVRRLRGPRKKRQAYLRFESEPGAQMQIDWGHFGSLAYGSTHRKLYALAVVEAYSRMLYVEFTHSQNQYSLHRCLLNAFMFFGGCPKEVLVDNMVTAVIERRGAMVRFNDRFLEFLQTFAVVPAACNPGAPHEKGKVENAIKYIRRNFWPLRTFIDLADVQSQVRHWLDAVANVRVHHTTGKPPVKRFKDVKLRPLPELLPDFRELCRLKVHKDFAVRFDGNTYTVPPWTVGKTLTLKADTHRVTLYHQDKKVTTHPRCWQRHCRIESQNHREQVKKLNKRLWHDRQIAAFASLGTEARTYLQGLLDTHAPIKKNVAKILALKDEYGLEAIITAIGKALTFNAYGADYIENILYQAMTTQKYHPPVKLKNEALNRIVLTQPSLADYDAHVLQWRKKDDR